MRLSIPVYIEQRHDRQRQKRVYSARPLFHPRPMVSKEDLSAALTKLSQAVRTKLSELGRERDHEELARFAWSPELKEHLVEVGLNLRKRTVRCRFLFVELHGFGARMAFTPSLPELWFMMEKRQSVRERGTEVLTRHFRDLEKKGGSAGRSPEDVAVERRAWLTSLDMEFFPEQRTKPTEDKFWTLMGGDDEWDGAEELEKVGRSLDWMYPDELNRCVLREDELSELKRVLDERSARPVLLLGPTGVGKTCLIHEHVFRGVEERKNPYAARRNTFLLSPQRLIAGMMYVGQWESRLLAILDEAHKRDHLLYFDDVLGLYHAGVSSQSDLSVAHVLKPRVQRHEVRVVAEMTPEAYRVFQEQDRSFADSFHLIPVRELPEAENLRILIRVMRQAEGAHHCRYGLGALPTVIDLQRRYMKEIAFPGKAAEFLKALAVKHPDTAIERPTVVQEFQARTGLAASFFDDEKKLDRADVIEGVGRKLIGQRPAVEAVANTIVTAKARLNDPTRPLGTFLFLGPTGVGKTQCAKAVASFLFGDESRVLRFDTNEYLDPYSATRLAGDHLSPDGLLTGAVRRQPFSVVLLDEIEKAHPLVFDLLLQVLGEGRLSDARGRTADFTNSLVIMTSNLGVEESVSAMGFQRGEAAEDLSVFLQAAERYFRPEFFNRIDQVIPFQRLSREEVGQIAKMLIGDVFSREGLVRRRCQLQIHPVAMERVVAQGYHPQLGARALKRAIERQITRPTAARLAATEPGSPAVIGLYPRGSEIAVQVQALAQATPASGAQHSMVDVPLEERRERFHQWRAAAEGEVDGRRPHGEAGSGGVSSEHYRYFAMRERLQRIQRHGRFLSEKLASSQRRVVGRRRYPAERRRPERLRRVSSYTRSGQGWGAALSAQDIHQYLAECAADALPLGAEQGDDWDGLFRECALLQAMLDGSAKAPRALLWLRGIEAVASDSLKWLHESYRRLFDRSLSLDCAVPESDHESLDDHGALLVVDGPHALALAGIEQGTHLFSMADGGMELVQAFALPLAEGAEPGDGVVDLLERRRRWLEGVADGAESIDGDPLSLCPVVRVYEQEGHTLDLRTGLLAERRPSVGELRSFLLSQVKWPKILTSERGEAR